MKHAVPVKRALSTPFSALQGAMNDLFHRFAAEDWPKTAWPEWPTGWQETAGEFWPTIDVEDDGESLVITAELPGLEQKDVTITLTGDLLTLKGEKKAEKEERKKNFYRSERAFGSFTRSFRLPCEVEQDKILATFKNGILRVGLPKVASARESVKQIEIKAS